MSPRVTALALALIAIALTLAQDAFPARDWYHAWQYATILILAIIVMLAYANGARRGADGPAGRRLALAMLGAVVVALAGLTSGLLGPDTITVIGSPGTVTPVPDLGVAAFFPPAGPATIEHGDAVVTLRRRGASALDVANRPTLLDLSVATTRTHPAAYIEARSARGDRLTITQPNNPAFLSPVMLFRQTQPIRGKEVPLDEFAVPAEHRLVHILYFTAADLAAMRPGTPVTSGGAVLSVGDDQGKELGLTIAPSGHEVPIAGLEITITMGSYPVLVVASAPQPYALGAGCVVFAFGCVWALLALRERRAERVAEVPV